MQRHGVSATRLPSGSNVQFHPPSIWEAQPGVVIAVAAALLVQSGLIVALLGQLRRRRLAEKSLRESEERQLGRGIGQGRILESGQKFRPLLGTGQGHWSYGDSILEVLWMDNPLRRNKKHEDLTGYSGLELANMTIVDWFSEEDLASVTPEWERVFTEGAHDHGGERQRKTAPESLIWRLECVWRSKVNRTWRVSQSTSRSRSAWNWNPSTIFRNWPCFPRRGHG